MESEGGDVMKELHRLIRKADKLYDGQVEFSLNEEDNDEMNFDDNWVNIFFFITPKEGLYRDARIKFYMRVNPTGYPDQAPMIFCLNSIYHPNIDIKADHEQESEVCVNILGGDWEEGVGLDGAIMAVLFLFYHPEIDDALNTMCNCNGDYDQYAANVRLSLRGESIDGSIFDKLLGYSTDEEEDDGNDGNKEDITKGNVEEAKYGAGAGSEEILEKTELGKAELVEKFDLDASSAVGDVAGKTSLTDIQERDDVYNEEVVPHCDLSVMSAPDSIDLNPAMKSDFTSNTRTSPYSVFQFWFSKLKGLVFNRSILFKKRS